MDIQLSASDLRVFSAVNVLPEGQALISILKRALSESDKRSRTLEGAALHRAQGNSICLADLIEKFGTAGSTLKPHAAIPSRDVANVRFAKPEA
jgi:hypothetical protein